MMLAVAAGLTVGWLLPRGPVTTSQALAAVILGLVLGAAVVILARSRWVLLVAPVLFVAGYELVRLPVDGPTVDAIRLDGIYGALLFVVGRGVDGLLIILPMLVGAGYTLALVRRRDRSTSAHRLGLFVGRAVLAVGTAAVVILVAGLLRPAGTEPITAADGAPVPGSIAELTAVDVGGHTQHVMIRGEDTTAPVLLFLEGGPGGSALGRIRRSAEPLEHHFVVATWDQRGTGKSYPALEPTSTLTLAQAVSDTLEVTDYLRDRFDQEQIYLVGSSWGTLIGVLAAQERPEAFAAYIGTGQMADPFATDQLMYAENLAQADRTGDGTRAEKLRAMGPPPYTEALDYLEALAGNPEWMSFPHGPDYDPASEYPYAFFVAEYTLIEQLRGMAALAETYAILYPQLAEVDLRRDVPRLEVPVYLLQGVHEADGRTVLAEEWYANLTAPHKQWITLDHSGHTPPYDEPGHFAKVLTDTVLGTSRLQ